MAATIGAKVSVRNATSTRKCAIFHVLVCCVASVTSHKGPRDTGRHIHRQLKTESRDTPGDRGTESSYSHCR